MHRGTWSLAAAVCLTLSQPASQVAEAACWDWLFGREPARPNVAYYAPATTCAPCSPATVAYSVPTTTSSAPATTCGSAPMMYGTPQTVVPTQARINPIPQTYYRTTYKQIPVTVYRPVTGTDVVTGYPVAINRACTTTEWQARRVPTGVLGMGYHPGLHTSMSVPMTTSAAPSCGCGAATTMPATPPYYTPPAGSMTVPPTSPPMTPSTALPPTAPPMTPSTTIPGSPPTMAPGGSVEPAEQRPSLSESPGVLNGAQFLPTTPQANTAQPASSTPVRTAPLAPIPPRGGNLQLRPVPDPDAPRQTTPANSNEAPQLLNPRDRMAAAPTTQNWAYSTINWPANHSATKRTESPQPAQSRDSGWDASGWTSVPGK